MERRRQSGCWRCAATGSASIPERASKSSRAPLQGRRLDRPSARRHSAPMPFARWARRCWYFLNRRRLEHDLEREMALHRAQMSEPQRFGNAIRLREESADVWGWTWIDDLRQDLRHGARLLWRAPGFAIAAIATIALGIGASTAIFSVAYGVSLRPDRKSVV